MDATVAKRAVAALALSAAGIAGISLHEGRVYTAYRDPVGIVTICDGHTRTAVMGQRATDSTCDRLLREDTRAAQATVKRLVHVPVTQRQYDELVDFTFNVGSGNFASSALLKKINAGECLAAGKEFLRWTYAKGKYLPGLLKRRQDNKEGWDSGC